ncbi:MAG: hypothetical protein B9S26_15200 [Opitutia bacterium Tous-C4FEB]|nr:MAG: hypothetical protein B9S26_15200 [Opitutae bacterium Tous-C4FEB]
MISLPWVRRVVLTGVLTVIGTNVTKAAVNLIIDNQSGSEIWLQWTGTSVLTGTVANAIGGGTTYIAPSDYNDNANGYQLSSFQSIDTNKYLIANYTQGGGRLWFTEGSSGFTFNNPGYTPALETFSDINFTKRYDKIEASITGSTDDNIDMTMLDGFSIPFTVTGYKSTNPAVPTQTLKGSTTDKILSALGAVAANPSAPAPAGGYPAVTSYSPYLVINSNSVNANDTPVGSSGSFVRVIANDQAVSPQNGADPVVQANGGQIPANYLYKGYAGYLSKMDGTAATGTFSGVTTVKGQFAGLGTKATDDAERKQNYNLTATFSATETMTMTNSQGVSTNYTGVMTLTGTTTLLEGPNSGTETHVVIKTPYAAMLAPTGIVGANAGYMYSKDNGVTWSYTGVAGPQDNVFTWLNGDVLAGMNVGTIGSDKLFSGTINGTLYTNVKIGEIATQDMFALGQVMAAANPGTSVYDYYFSYLQGTSDFYNDYAAALYKLTDAYGFAYSDRIQGGQVSISWDATQADALDTIVITILPDVVPEPGTMSLVLLAGGAWALKRRSRRQTV